MSFDRFRRRCPACGKNGIALGDCFAGAWQRIRCKRCGSLMRPWFAPMLLLALAETFVGLGGIATSLLWLNAWPLVAAVLLFLGGRVLIVPLVLMEAAPRKLKHDAAGRNP